MAWVLGPLERRRRAWGSLVCCCRKVGEGEEKDNSELSIMTTVAVGGSLSATGIAGLGAGLRARGRGRGRGRGMAGSVWAQRLSGCLGLYSMLRIP